MIPIPAQAGRESGPEKVAGIAAVIRDVTQRWDEERGLHRRLAELESALESALKG